MKQLLIVLSLLAASAAPSWPKASPTLIKPSAKLCGQKVDAQPQSLPASLLGTRFVAGAHPASARQRGYTRVRGCESAKSLCWMGVT